MKHLLLALATVFVFSLVSSSAEAAHYRYGSSYGGLHHNHLHHGHLHHGHLHHGHVHHGHLSHGYSYRPSLSIHHYSSPRLNYHPRSVYRSRSYYVPRTSPYFTGYGNYSGYRGIGSGYSTYGGGYRGGYGGGYCY